MPDNDKRQQPTPASSSRLLAYLQLLRLPNVFTAMADVAMGFIFVRGVADFGRAGSTAIAELAVLIVASSLLYLAGMVLNDWFDYDTDRQERPRRPLPSGRIARSTAARLGWGLLVSGVVAASAAGYLLGSTLPAGVAVALAVCIVLYDGPLKRTPLGPLAMGGCRMLNVLLGMSATGINTTGTVWQTENWLVAAAIGVYIAGLTFYARHETDEHSDRRRLLTGIAVMMLGIVLLARLPSYMHLTIPGPKWHLFMMLLGALIAWQCLRPMIDPRPKYVQRAVKQSILSLVFLDAAVVLAVAGPVAAVAVLALLIPTVVLGRLVYST
jgi:4-hydroxybenzoate polyprenyltransferase